MTATDIITPANMVTAQVLAALAGALAMGVVWATVAAIRAAKNHNLTARQARAQRMFLP